MKLMKKILFLLILFLTSVSNAAEFEVMDMLTVNGITNLKSSATIIVGDNVPSSIWISTSATTSHLYISTAGKVGIGTASPDANLDISGSGSKLRLTTIDTSITQMEFFEGASERFSLGYNPTNNRTHLWSAVSGKSMVYLEDDGDLILQPTSGNVGIATDNPGAALHISGSGTLKVSAENNPWQPSITLATTADMWKIYKTGGYLAFRNVYDFGGGISDRLVIGGTSDVGIGDIPPDYRLDVAGTMGIDGILTMTGTAANIALGLNYLSGDGNDEGIFVDGSGNVGIGTTLSQTLNSDWKHLRLGDNGGLIWGPTAAHSDVHIMSGLYHDGTDWRFSEANKPGSTFVQSSGDYKLYSDSDTVHSAGDTAAITVKMVVKGDGKVGIGTDSPTHKLDVNGAMYSRRYATTTAINWNNGNTQSITLAATPTTLTFANGQDGGKYTLIIKQDGTGSRTITWPASVRFPDGVAPTLTTTAAKTDYIGFIYNGVDSKYDAVAFMKGL